MELPRTVLAFGPGSWPAGWVYGSPRYHLHGLAGGGWRVVYVEPPQGRLRNRGILKGDRVYRPRAFDAWPDRALSVYHPATRLFFHPRLPLPSGILGAWNRFALGRLAREVRAGCVRSDRSDFARPDLLWLGAYHHAPLLDRVPHGKSVAFVYDDLPSSPAWGAKQGALVGAMERNLLERVDLAIFTSKVLLDSKGGWCARSLLLENAVSEEYFDESLPPRPSPGKGSGVLERVDALPRPRIGYVGAVNLRLDPAICAKLGRHAAARDWHVVFAGGVDRFYRGSAEELQSMPNVHVPGHVPPDEVPRLLRLFDVLILPHVVTPFTRAMFPEKLPEYLATGRPIVSTRLPEVERVAGADDLGVRFADMPETFIAGCAEALKENDPPRVRARIDLARLHTRRRRLEALEPVLLDLLNR